jgi:hypothetical protein
VRAFDTTLSPEFSLLNSEFNAFLFAPIGEERNDTVVTVLSALARLGVDPWQESARLAQLSREMAKERLASIISALPNGRWMPSDIAPIAARLIDLLPAKSTFVAPAVSTFARKRPASSTIVLLVVMAVLGGSIVSAIIGHINPVASPDSPFPTMTSSPEGPGSSPSK